VLARCIFCLTPHFSVQIFYIATLALPWYHGTWNSTELQLSFFGISRHLKVLVFCILLVQAIQPFTRAHNHNDRRSIWHGHSGHRTSPPIVSATQDRTTTSAYCGPHQGQQHPDPSGTVTRLGAALPQHQHDTPQSASYRHTSIHRLPAIPDQLPASFSVAMLYSITRLVTFTCDGVVPDVINLDNSLVEL
jgi:hypothetical protein